ncbi:hypothetical protein MT356_17085 [Rathayibacter festucae]|jgi:hypothetical protein|uniref:hypothetical protein n=1 Tax=Rathayibacter festucae TaxID=110937 RepID=UPI001FB5265E|nr:hypothetical protein [Rathayibacter festucae]MCJ1701425.1 hypothetical protein [Rathayibacter festucae]
MREQEARSHHEESAARAASFGQGMLTATYALRHEKGLDVVFLLRGTGPDFLIGMGAASDDFRSVLSIGLDSRDGVLRPTASHTIDGRRRGVPARVVYRSDEALVVEASPLPLRDRPASLKCWSFVRSGEDEHYSDVVGFVAPSLATLPPVPLKTRPRAQARR